ncbi:MAG: V-type ATP synthase subunit I, partial [Alistipes sp.]|nr:V-type ATP synthase subunit I [Alistipes sp.]
MMKYDFVLFAAQSEDFIQRLRELGLVDITTAGWEPSEDERQLLLDIEGHAKAAECIADFRRDERHAAALRQAVPFGSAVEAYEHYVAAQQQAAALRTEIGRLEKLADELRA